MTPLTPAWWNAPAFYPSTGVFAFSENLLGLAPIAAPIIALTKSPLLAYNAAFLLSYVLCGLGAYFWGSCSPAGTGGVRGGRGVRVRAVSAVAHTAPAAAVVALDARVDRSAASLHPGREGAVGGALRSELAAPGTGVRLLPLLSHALRRLLAGVPRRAPAVGPSDGGPRRRVARRRAPAASRYCSATGRFRPRTVSSGAPSRSSTTAQTLPACGPPLQTRCCGGGCMAPACRRSPNSSPVSPSSGFSWSRSRSRFRAGPTACWSGSTPLLRR